MTSVFIDVNVLRQVISYIAQNIYFSLFLFLDLIRSLHQSTAVAAAGHESIVGLVSLNAVGLPGLGPQHHYGDAGGDAAQQEVEETTLAQVLSSGVDQAAPAPSGHAT